MSDPTSTSAVTDGISRYKLQTSPIHAACLDTVLVRMGVNRLFKYVTHDVLRAVWVGEVRMDLNASFDWHFLIA